MTGKEAREARLAVQLRANLKRRKAAPIVEDPCVAYHGRPDQTADEK